MLKTTINELRSIAKSINISGYKNVSKNQLINLLIKTMKEFISKLSKKS